MKRQRRLSFKYRPRGGWLAAITAFIGKYKVVIAVLETIKLKYTRKTISMPQKHVLVTSIQLGAILIGISKEQTDSEWKRSVYE